MDTVHLIGAETVMNAARKIDAASADLRQASINLDSTIAQFGEFVSRFENAVERLILDWPGAQ